MSFRGLFEGSLAFLRRIALTLVNDRENVEIAGRDYPVYDRIGQAGNRELPRAFNDAFSAEEWKILEYFDDLPDARKDTIGGIPVELRNMGVNFT
jgi:hypothetical protein